jgi:hypothetical protein
LAGAHLRVGQPDDFLADHRQRAGDTDDQDKNQIGSASQLCTRNHSLERDFFDMIARLDFDERARGYGLRSAGVRKRRGRGGCLCERPASL